MAPSWSYQRGGISPMAPVWHPLQWVKGRTLWITGALLPTGLWESLWNEGNSIWGLYRFYYGMFRGATKGRERNRLRHFEKEQAWENGCIGGERGRGMCVGLSTNSRSGVAGLSGLSIWLLDRLSIYDQLLEGSILHICTHILPRLPTNWPDQPDWGTARGHWSCWWECSFFCLCWSMWPVVCTWVYVLHVRVHVCLLGTRTHYRLDLGTWSCSSLNSVGLSDLVDPNNF